MDFTLTTGLYNPVFICNKDPCVCFYHVFKRFINYINMELSRIFLSLFTEGGPTGADVHQIVDVPLQTVVLFFFGISI